MDLVKWLLLSTETVLVLEFSKNVSKEIRRDARKLGSQKKRDR